MWIEKVQKRFKRSKGRQLPPFGAEPFVFQVAIQKFEDQDI